MEKLTKLIKKSNKNTKLVVALGAAAAVGAATGLKVVAKKRTGNLAAALPTQKVSDLLTATATAGSKVVEEVREDINTVVESVKNKTEGCGSKCQSCDGKDCDKPCCKKDGECKKGKEASETEVPYGVLPEVPEPVKAADVVEKHKETDAEVETTKNEKLVEEAPAAEVKKKPVARKPRAPRTPKAAAEKTEMTPAEPQPADEPEEK